MTANSSNHSFPDGWLVMLQRICPVRLQSDRDPEFEHPEHCGGYVLSSESRERAAQRPFVSMDPSASRPCAVLSFPHPSENPEIWGPALAKNS